MTFTLRSREYGLNFTSLTEPSMLPQGEQQESTYVKPFRIPMLCVTSGRANFIDRLMSIVIYFFQLFFFVCLPFMWRHCSFNAAIRVFFLVAIK